MSHRKRTKLESAIQREIEAAIGSKGDLLLLRNSVGHATYHDANGKEWHTPYGLGVGTPDLVGILAPSGRWFCLEVKTPGEQPEPEQSKCHELWRRFGAFVATVRSADDAIAALELARAEEATPSLHSEPQWFIARIK